MGNTGAAVAQVRAARARELAEITWPEKYSVKGELATILDSPAADGLTGYDVAVLSAIFSFTDRFGRARPTMEQICRRAHVKRTACKSAIQTLRKKRLLVRKLPPTGSRGIACEYRLPNPNIRSGSRDDPHALCSGSPTPFVQGRETTPKDPSLQGSKTRAREEPLPLSASLAEITARVIAKAPKRLGNQLSLGPVGQVLSPDQQATREASAGQQTGTRKSGVNKGSRRDRDCRRLDGKAAKR